ncbi:MAG: hypothetical protein KOO60_00255 [Gemmatimonadales bacterium]|nr:hypothetical protein [Gemmatimonadales bacterium]
MRAIAVFFLALILSPAEVDAQTPELPGRSFEKRLQNLTPDKMVLVGTVIEVEPAEYLQSNGRCAPIPKITIDVDLALYGDPGDSIAVFGYNTFYRTSDGGWGYRIGELAPWITPGDIVLVVTIYVDRLQDAATGKGFHRIRTVLFLEDNNYTPESPLFERKTRVSNSLKNVLADSMSYESLLTFIEKTNVGTKFTLKQIQNAIPSSNGGEK